MLSVCLVFSVITYWSSYRNIEKREALRKAGAYHAEYIGVGAWQMKKIEKSHAICEYYVTNDFLNSVSENISYHVKVLLKSKFDCRRQIKDLAVNMGISEENINYNTTYLDAYSIEISDIFGLVLLIFFILFIAIIFVLDIYNIYFSQTVKMHGIFKAIGFNNLQLVIFSLYEALILGTCGIIAGIVSGIGASYLVVPFLDKINQSSTDAIVDISGNSFLAATVAGYFVVLFAIYWSLKKTLHLSVTGAYNYNSVNIKRIKKGKLAEKSI